MYVKIHNREGRTIVAIADKEIIGKSFEEGKLQLDVSERFFKGEEKSEEEILKLLREAENINIVGKKIVKLAIKHRIISNENIIKIQGVPTTCIFFNLK